MAIAAEAEADGKARADAAWAEYAIQMPAEPVERLAALDELAREHPQLSEMIARERKRVETMMEDDARRRHNELASRVDRCLADRDYDAAAALSGMTEENLREYTEASLRELHERVLARANVEVDNYRKAMEDASPDEVLRLLERYRREIRWRRGEDEFAPRVDSARRQLETAFRAIRQRARADCVERGEDAALARLDQEGAVFAGTPFEESLREERERVERWRSLRRRAGESVWEMPRRVPPQFPVAPLANRRVTDASTNGVTYETPNGARATLGWDKIPPEHQARLFDLWLPENAPEREILADFRRAFLDM